MSACRDPAEGVARLLTVELWKPLARGSHVLLLLSIPSHTPRPPPSGLRAKRCGPRRCPLRHLQRPRTVPKHPLRRPVLCGSVEQSQWPLPLLRAVDSTRMASLHPQTTTESPLPLQGIHRVTLRNVNQSSPNPHSPYPVLYFGTHKALMKLMECDLG